MTENRVGFGCGFGSDWILWIIVILVIFCCFCPGFFGGVGYGCRD